MEEGRLSDRARPREGHTAAQAEHPRADLYRGGLERQQVGGDVRRHHRLVEPGPRLAREVPGHLEIDQIGREQALAGPALVEQRDQIGGEVDCPAVAPAILDQRESFSPWSRSTVSTFSSPWRASPASPSIPAAIPRQPRRFRYPTAKSARYEPASPSARAGRRVWSMLSKMRGMGEEREGDFGDCRRS